MGLRLTLAAVLCLALPSAFAQAVNVAIGPGNSLLSLPLPDAAFAGEDTQLSVDLDGYDVTGFARIEDRTLRVELEVPLSAGEHALALFAFHADGTAEVLVDVVLNVQEPDHGTWALNTLFETNYRAAEHPGTDYEGVDSVANSGSVAFSGSDSSGNWGRGLAFEAIYDESSGSVPGSDDWLLPSYEIYAGYGGETSSFWAVGGNIGVAREDLLFSSYQRRGAALEAAAAAGRFELKAFSVNSQPRNGFGGDYIIPSDSDAATAGLSTTLAVVEKRLELSGGYVDGKSRFGGDGFNLQNDPLVFGGDSWNIALDSRWLGDGLWIHLERAESDFDADGIGVGFAATADDAVQAQLQLASGEQVGAGPFAYWRIVLRHSKVGRDFYSMGNLALPGNLETNGAWFQGGFTSVVVDVELAREETNPDDDPSFASQTLERSGLSVAWSPATLNLESGLFRLLGAPSVSAWLYRIDNSQPDADALIAGFDVDNVTDDRGVTLSFARDALNWSLEYGAVDYDDQSSVVTDNGFIIYEPYSDSRNRYLSATASWVPGERVGFEVYLQRNRLEETDFGDEYRSINYGVSGSFLLVPDKLRLFASMSRGEDRNSFGDPQFTPERLESKIASLQLNWRVTDAEANSPAVNLFFKGNYGRNENPGLLLDQDFWAVYVGASINWTQSK